VAGTLVRCALVAGALIALSPPLALAQTADDLSGLRKDIDALKEGQAALLRELQQIKDLLSAPPSAPRAGPAPEAVLTVRSGTSKGSKDAKVTLVEFTDYQ
jgi:protein-disulfide isomerase